MATGWAHEGAVQDQIEDTDTNGVLITRARLHVGEGAELRVECGDDIPEARCKALPGAQTCVSCQSGRDSPSFWWGSIAGAAKTASCADPPSAA